MSENKYYLSAVSPAKSRQTSAVFTLTRRQCWCANNFKKHEVLNINLWLSVFSSIRPEGLIFYYFGIEGSVSEPGLISG